MHGKFNEIERVDVDSNKMVVTQINPKTNNEFFPSGQFVLQTRALDAHHTQRRSRFIRFPHLFTETSTLA